MIVQRHIDFLVVPTRTVLFPFSRIVQEYILWVMLASMAGLCRRTIEIIDIECVLGQESCLHFFSCMPLHSRHILKQDPGFAGLTRA